MARLHKQVSSIQRMIFRYSQHGNSCLFLLPSKISPHFLRLELKLPVEKGNLRQCWQPPHFEQEMRQDGSRVPSDNVLNVLRLCICLS